MNARSALVIGTLTLALVIPTAAGAVRSPHHLTMSGHVVSHQTAKQRQAIAKAAKARANARAAKLQRRGRPLLIWVRTTGSPAPTMEYLDPCEVFGYCSDLASTSIQDSPQAEASAVEQTSASAVDETQASVDTSSGDSPSVESVLDTSSVDYSDC